MPMLEHDIQSSYDLFDQRMELDYRDFAEVSGEDARRAVLAAKEFVTAIKALTCR